MGVKFLDSVISVSASFGSITIFAQDSHGSALYCLAYDLVMFTCWVGSISHIAWLFIIMAILVYWLGFDHNMGLGDLDDGFNVDDMMDTYDGNIWFRHDRLAYYIIIWTHGYGFQILNFNNLSIWSSFNSHIWPITIVFFQCLNACLHIFFIYAPSIFCNSSINDLNSTSLYGIIIDPSYLVIAFSWCSFFFTYPNKFSKGFNHGEY